MPWTAPNPSPMCPACSRSVFPAEAYMATDRRPFHKVCVKCTICSKKLSPTSLNEHSGQLFCEACYTIKFMPKENKIPERVMMQVLPVGGTYTAIEEEKRRAEQERLARERKEGARQNGGCPACSMLTGPDDFAEVSGLRYHKACLCCTACSRPAEVDTPMLLGPRENENVFGDEQLDPYCNICFAKKFKMSVLNIADTVNIIKGL